MRYFQFQYLLLQAGWKENCFVGINAKGKINYLSCENPETEGHIEFVAGATLPGFVNAHSHSFQYAMAGQAETHEPKTDDDFWSWRDAMYSCALSMTPDKLEKVTTLLYQQLVANGYTRVVEFHYLHKLESEGVLEVEVENIGNRVRKYYSLTKTGKKAKSKALTELENFSNTLQLLLNPKLA